MYRFKILKNYTHKDVLERGTFEKVLFGIHLLNTLLFLGTIIGLFFIVLRYQEYCIPLSVQLFDFQEIGDDLVVSSVSKSTGCLFLEWVFIGSAFISMIKHLLVLIFYPRYVQASLRGWYYFDLIEYIPNSIPPVLALIWLNGSVDIITTIPLASTMAVVNLGGLAVHWYISHVRVIDWRFVWYVFGTLAVLSSLVWVTAASSFIASNLVSTRSAPWWVWVAFFTLAPQYYAFGFVSAFDLLGRQGNVKWAVALLNRWPLFHALFFAILGTTAKLLLIWTFEFGVLSRDLA